jgi:hypothetical protein
VASRKEYELLMKLQAALGSNFNTTFQTAMNATKSLQGKLQDLKRTQNDISAYQKSEASVKALKEEKARLESATDRNEAAIARVNTRLIDEENRLAAVSERLKAAGVDTNNLAGENDRLQKSYDDLKRAQEEYARAADAVEKNRAAISATRTELLKTVGVATAAGAALYKGFVEPAAGMESAMRNIQASTGYTGEEMERVLAGVRAAALATGTDVHKLAMDTMNLVETGGDIGLMLGQLEHGLNLANATGTDAGQTFDFLSAAMKTFGLDVEHTQAVVDSFSYATTMTNLNLGQISEAFVNVGGSAAQAGMGVNDVNAILIALSEAGLKGGAAGTSLNGILRNLSTPTDKAAAALAELNIELYDQHGASRDMLLIMSDLQGALGDMTDEQRNHYQSVIFDTVV